MPIPKPPRASVDRPLLTVQDNIAGVVDQLVAVPILDGVLSDAVAIGTGDTYVPHGLGRVPRGFIAVSPNANATIYTSGTASPDAARIAVLIASAAVTSRLWWF